MKLDNTKTIALVGISCFLLGAILTYFFLPFLLPSSIDPIPDRDYFPYVHSLFQNARNSIHIVMFIMRYYPEYNESEANILLQDLINAKNRGLEVKVILEGGEDFLGQEFTEDQKKACLFLQDSGVEVKFDPNGVNTHAKLLVIDDTVVLGSTNWNYYALEKNHETSAAITSKIFKAVYEQYFWNLWRASKEAYCEPESYELNASIEEILLDRDYYDGKTVKINGTVSNIKRKTSKAGNDYATFKLNSDSGESLKIFTFGNPKISENDFVTVKGPYHKEKIVSGFKYYDEVEAEEIEKT